MLKCNHAHSATHMLVDIHGHGHKRHTDGALCMRGNICPYDAWPTSTYFHPPCRRSRSLFAVLMLKILSARPTFMREKPVLFMCCAVVSHRIFLKPVKRERT